MLVSYLLPCYCGGDGSHNWDRQVRRDRALSFDCNHKNCQLLNFALYQTHCTWYSMVISSHIINKSISPITQMTLNNCKVVIYLVSSWTWSTSRYTWHHTYSFILISNDICVDKEVKATFFLWLIVVHGLSPS